MLDKIDENRQQGAKPNSVKVRISRGATIDAMKDFPSPYLKRSTTNTILHVGLNNSINDSSNVILSKLVSLKNFIHPESNVIFSNIIDISDIGIVVSGQLPTRKIVPRITAPRTIAPEDNCPRGKLYPG